MKSLSPLRFAVASLALAGCGEEPAPPPPPPLPPLVNVATYPPPRPPTNVPEALAHVTFGWAGECTHADVLAIAAQAAGVPVEQAGEPVLIAIQGLEGNVPCPDAVEIARDALDRRNARTPLPRTLPLRRPPPTAVQKAAEVVRRILPRLHR